MNVTVSYELHDAFPDSHEFVTHVVGAKTKKLRLKVHFDPGRVGREVNCYVTLGTGHNRPIGPIQVNAVGDAEIVIPRPRTAARYTIVWDW